MPCTFMLLSVYRWRGIVLDPFLSLYFLLKGFLSEKKDASRADLLGYPSIYCTGLVGLFIWFHAVRIGWYWKVLYENTAS
ncbi:hypothetical protein [Candidatus Liberibacter sp.]|uniref:hypothetical protein n=1 Tax=Candidatus Liberibacter sp. TaxID=34022 RepID=UPI0015F4D290|nr:hypothetical protein [Candidatus Liberibacter sp.]MBA5723637.1 hypothetical protein [Candidatus Liberibacter sp.]